MSYTLELLRDWRCAHRGEPEKVYKAGVYAVPDDLPYDLARRMVDARVAVNASEAEERATKRAPRNRSRKLAPENKRLA